MWISLERASIKILLPCTWYLVRARERRQEWPRPEKRKETSAKRSLDQVNLKEATCQRQIQCKKIKNQKKIISSTSTCSNDPTATASHCLLLRAMPASLPAAGAICQPSCRPGWLLWLWTLWAWKAHFAGWITAGTYILGGTSITSHSVVDILTTHHYITKLPDLRLQLL